ncbi:hypothetical protein ACVWXU_005709 [Streptomyces sp. TE33382]
MTTQADAARSDLACLRARHTQWNDTTGHHLVLHETGEEQPRRLHQLSGRSSANRSSTRGRATRAHLRAGAASYAARGTGHGARGTSSTYSTSCTPTATATGELLSTVKFMVQTLAAACGVRRDLQLPRGPPLARHGLLGSPWRTVSRALAQPQGLRSSAPWHA